MSASSDPISEAREASRRAFLVRAGAVLTLAASGWTTSSAASPVDLAKAFEAVRIDDAFRALGGTPTTSDRIAIELPDVAENGAFVPVTVTSAIAGTEEIMLLVDFNPYPMIVRFAIANGTEPYIATRVKLAQTCSVCALVRAGDRLYCAARDTNVIVGGCG